MMKHVIYSFLFLSTLLTSTGFATSTVCSSEQLYYSNVRKDYGIQPLPGTLMGTRVIVHRGKLLVSHEFIQGLGQHSILPYQVELRGEPIVLETKGTQISGSRIFKQTAVLSKMTLAKAEEVAQVEVLCRSVWAVVP